MLAVAMGLGTLAILGAGWWVVLKTRFRIAGQALTFLGCVVTPLNLWFYDYQTLVTVNGNLWLGGVICCLLYVATVYVLRDPLFLYAVEAGVTLTVAPLPCRVRSGPRYGLPQLGADGAGADLGPQRAGLSSRRAHLYPAAFRHAAVLVRSCAVGGSLVVLLGSQIAGWLVGPQRQLLPG